MPGWVDAVSAAGALFLIAGIGMLSDIPGNPQGIGDVIPVDMVVSHCLLAARDVWADRPGVEKSINARTIAKSKYPMNKSLHMPETFYRISHIGSSDSQVPMRWRTAGESVISYFKRNPRVSRSKAAGSAFKYPPSFDLHPSHQVFQLIWFLKYWLPQSIYNTAANAMGNTQHIERAAKMKRLYEKSYDIVKLFKPFTCREYIFKSQLTRAWSTGIATTGEIMSLDTFILSPIEMATFCTDTNQIVWARYLENFCYGLVRWVLGEDVMPVTDQWLLHNNVALTTERLVTWDPDHHRISFPKLLPDSTWAFTHGRRAGYTSRGFIGNLLRITGWRENHIERPLGRDRGSIIASVLASEIVQCAIQSEAIRKCNSNKSPNALDTATSNLYTTAYEIIDRMAANVDHSGMTFRGTAIILRKILRRLYGGIRVDEKSVQKVRDIAKKFPKAPLILIPSHRSYMDFIMISYLMFAYNLPLPHIAASEVFLQMTFFTRILRGCGAFFIKRSKEGDSFKVLYDAIFKEYTQQLLGDGQWIEFFIEGTRSRSGKSLIPKLGMLKICMDTFLDGRIDGAHIVPVSIDYERPLESLLYSDEMLGGKKRPETFSNMLKGILGTGKQAISGLDYGHIAVQFGEPIRVENWVNTWISNNVSSHAKDIQNNLKDPKVSKTKIDSSFDRFEMVKDLGYKIIEELDNNSACMPTHLVASLILAFRQGISLDQLGQHFLWLHSQIVLRGGRVLCVEGDFKSVLVTRALKYLGPLVEKSERDVVHPAALNKLDLQYHLALGYYRNKIIHLFCREALWSVVIDAQIRHLHLLRNGFNLRNVGPIATGVDHYVDVKTVLDEVCFLCSTLRREFVLGKKGDLETTRQRQMRVLQLMRHRSLLKAKNQNIDNSKNTKCGESIESVSIHPRGEIMHSFLCSTILPFLDSYWVSLLAMFRLRGNGTGYVEQESALLSQIQDLAQALYRQGVISHYECCSLDTLRNALATFRDMGVLENAKLPLPLEGIGLRLLPLFSLGKSGSVDHLQQLTMRIGRLRRPGIGSRGGVRAAVGHMFGSGLGEGLTDEILMCEAHPRVGNKGNGDSTVSIGNKGNGDSLKSKILAFASKL